jgi:hypothetical protein
MRLSGFYLPVRHLSASALSLGMQCPEQYRQKHILKRKGGFFSDRLMGIVDHDVHTDNMLRVIHTGQMMPRDEILTRYTHYWKKEIEKNGEPDWKDKPDKLHDLGQKMALTYHAEIAHTLKPIRVEERFEFNIKELPVPIIGYIDTELEGAVLERKTTGQKQSTPKPAWNFQGRIYQLEARKPIEWHVVTKQVTPKVYTPENTEGGLRLDIVNPDVTVQMIVQAATTLNDYYARYGPDSTWPMTGKFHDWLCAYCAFGPKYEGSCLAWQ